MKLPELLTVDNLENVFANWFSGEDKTLELPISLPSPLPFCVEAPLLQVIASLSRKFPSEFAVQINGLTSNAASYQSTLTSALGNPHIVCAWQMANEVQDEHGNPIPKEESRAFSQYLDAMDSYEFLRTHATMQMRANLVCIQGARREFIQPLYHEVKGKKIVRPVPDVRLFVQDILSQLAPTWTGSVLRQVASPLATLVKELMENADWWARTNEMGKVYRPGKAFRVLSFRLVDIDNENAEIFGGSNPHLQNYLQTILLQQGETDRAGTAVKKRIIKRHKFIELSVVDSGPGLARRWLASREQDVKYVSNLNDISIQEEEEAVVECFKKWATSSHSSLRGIGLFSVAKMLREKNGFMRLRSGRLSYLFGTQSAIKDVEDRIKGKGKIGKSLHHALDDGTHVFTEDYDIAFFLRPWNKNALSAVEGTSYSILLPV
jgi:hypothetical protein